MSSSNHSVENPAKAHSVSAFPEKLRAKRRSLVLRGVSFWQLFFLVFFVTCGVLGLFWMIEVFGPSPHFNNTLIRVVGSVATVLTTYFLVNRALRRREKESDAILVSFVAYIDFLIQTYTRSYDLKELSDQAALGVLEDLKELKGRSEIESYAKEMRLRVKDLPQYMLDMMRWPSFLRTSEERLLDIEEMTKEIISLLGLSSPKMAVQSLEVTDCYQSIYREDLPIIRRGFRAYRKLEWIIRYCQLFEDEDYAEAMEEDIAESVAAIFEAMQSVFLHLPFRLEEEFRGSLSSFRDNLSKTQLEIYDTEILAVGRLYEID